MFKIFGKISSLLGLEDLTDNFKANLILAFVLVSPVCFFYSRPFIPGESPIVVTIIFVSIYIFASRFYSPDLDHREKRPGMAHFPLGSTLIGVIQKSPLFPLLIIQQIVTKIWFYIWQPVTYFITHRGIFHWPIVGVIARNSYLLSIAFLLKKVFSAQLVDSAYNQLFNYYKLFFNIHSVDFIKFCLPIYIADITHSSVDLWDSLKRGYPFVASKTPRGLFAKLFGL